MVEMNLLCTKSKSSIGERLLHFVHSLLWDNRNQFFHCLSYLYSISDSSRLIHDKLHYPYEFAIHHYAAPIKVRHAQSSCFVVCTDLTYILNFPVRRQAIY